MAESSPPPMRKIVAESEKGAGAGSAATAGAPKDHPCPSCGATVAADQRYCTNCGARATAPRVDYQNYVKGETNGEGPPGAGPARAAPQGGREWSPLLVFVALAALGGMLLVGVLIGKSANDNNNTVTVATATGATTPRASATTPGATSTSGSSSTSFTSDWPAG